MSVPIIPYAISNHEKIILWNSMYPLLFTIYELTEYKKNNRHFIDFISTLKIHNFIYRFMPFFLWSSNKYYQIMYIGNKINKFVVGNINEIKTSRRHLDRKISYHILFTVSLTVHGKNKEIWTNRFQRNHMSSYKHWPIHRHRFETLQYMVWDDKKIYM